MQVAHALAQRKEENNRLAPATEEPSRERCPSSSSGLSLGGRGGRGRREEEQRKEEYLCFKMVAVKNNVVSTGTERQADQLQRRV